MKVPVFVIFNYGLSGDLEEIQYLLTLWLNGSYGQSIQVWEYEAAVFWAKSDILRKLPRGNILKFEYCVHILYEPLLVVMFLPAAQYRLVRTRSY